VDNNFKKKHIGITIGLTRDKESMWINGIKQNAIFLANALIHVGHKVTLLDTSSNVEAFDDTGKVTNVMWDYNQFPVYKYSKVARECDVLIMLGTTLEGHTLRYFKQPSEINKRIIKYMCGNNYVIDMERSIFETSASNQRTAWKSDGLVDECWYVPQQGYQNHEYYRVLMGLEHDKVKPVPFVWDPMFIDQIESLYDRNKNVPIYQPKENSEKKLCIFEPNMNVVKYSMIPLLIIEDAYVNHNIDYKFTTLISGDRLPKKTVWKSTIDSTKMIAKTIKTAGRLPVHSILANHADIVISHQWENPLNYAYLDTMYLQFPLIHNADMIQDAGYYYPDFEIGKGAEKLKWVMDHHDKHIDEYNEKNEKVLTRYTVYNEDLIETYRLLIENLFAKENINGLSYEYNWKTNTYK
jgi:hypothetical protein